MSLFFNVPSCLERSIDLVVSLLEQGHINSLSDNMLGCNTSLNKMTEYHKL